MSFQTKVYEVLVKPIFFKIDPEKIHDVMLSFGAFFGGNPLTRGITSLLFSYKNAALHIVVDGIHYQNPLGLAAGFDKNAHLMKLMSSIGFGFEEVGSITAQQCSGNQKPRVFRLPKDNALIINYGLCNDGAKSIAPRLRERRKDFPIGISIAKTNDKSICGEASVDDYYQSFSILKNLGDYITINISCPNSGDGRSFEDPIFLEALLKRIGKSAFSKKPIYLKISPDISKDNLDIIINLVEKYSVAGFVVTNLTHDRSTLKTKDKNLLQHKGGISGFPTSVKSDDLIKYIYKKTKGSKTIIAVGGIFSAEDAYRKIKNGASLVQLITGMIYKGPGLMSEINKELVTLLKKDGYKNSSEAIGSNVTK